MSCFGRGYPTVLVWDLQEEKIHLLRVDGLPDQQAIISRLPSRWTSSIHVYIEIVGRSSTQRAKVTTKRRNVIGMIPYCSIHLSKLSSAIRLRILLGEIRWISSNYLHCRNEVLGPGYYTQSLLFVQALVLTCRKWL
ncbi:hypothetical protein F4859DRAFT_474001, partial [Xylaria cf. heliscus]